MLDKPINAFVESSYMQAPHLLIPAGLDVRRNVLETQIKFVVDRGA